MIKRGRKGEKKKPLFLAFLFLRGVVFNRGFKNVPTQGEEEVDKGERRRRRGGDESEHINESKNFFVFLPVVCLSRGLKGGKEGEGRGGERDEGGGGEKEMKPLQWSGNK